MAKKKRKVRVRQKAKVVRKDTLPRMEARPPADVGATLKIKVRKK